VADETEDVWAFDPLDDIVPFGKHRGKSIRELPTDYVSWLLSKATFDWVDANRDTLERALTHVDESAVPDYTLADDQREAADDIEACLVLGEANAHRLQGGAGYGKSFACIDVVLRAKRAGFIVRACATSYVATQNLAKDLEPLGVECATIARTLQLDVIHRGMKDLYVPGDRTYGELAVLLQEGSMLIVDEYSMVDDTIGTLLLDAAARHGGKLLVVGDVYQLPSPAQDWDSNLCKVEPSCELVLPKRYAADSDLFKIEREVRQDPYQFDPDRYASSPEVGTVSTLDGLVDAYVRSYQDNPDDQHLMVWYRRADMAASNRQIRRALFSDGVAEIAPGEQLRVQRTADFTPYYGADGDRVYSGTTFAVREAHVGDQTITIDEAGLSFHIPCYWVDTDDLRRFAVLFSITENQAESGTRGADEFNAALRELAQWCDANNSWKPYRDFRNCFVQVAYQYASTVHRVQGQSVDRVFTCPNALRMADPYTSTKLQYVALTRAKKKLTCL